MKRRSRLKIALVTILTVVGLVLVIGHDELFSAHDTLAYSELLTAIDDGLVESISILPERDIIGAWKEDAFVAGSTRKGEFVVDFAAKDSDALIERASAAGVKTSFRKEPMMERVGRTLGNLLVVLLYVALFFLLRTQFAGMGSSVGERVTSVDTTFEDVAGTQGAAEELKEIVDFLKRPKEYRRMGAKIPRGALLVGPAGTGKTLMARAVAHEADVPFFHLSGGEVTGMIVGLGALRIKKIFAEARKEGGVIFIDEIDTLGAKRGQNRSHNEDDRTSTVLLSEMGGFKPTENVVVMAATNRPEILDEALLRPGRFDRHIHVGLPTTQGREEILKLHAAKRDVPLDDDVDLRRLAALTPGKSGAEMEHLINEAAIAAVREGAKKVAWRHFDQARDRLFLGRERKGFTPREDELAVVAYHEAGHALTGMAYVPEEDLHKVTIQPRGQALGVAHFSPIEDASLHRRRYLEGQLVKAMGGRAAEEIVNGPDEITSGAASDLEQANRIARGMVTRLGMGSETGFLIVSDSVGPLAPGTLERMDAEIREILARAYRKAITLLENNRVVLEAVAQALLERETLDRDELDQIVEQAGGLRVG